MDLTPINEVPNEGFDSAENTQKADDSYLSPSSSRFRQAVVIDKVRSPVSGGSENSYSKVKIRQPLWGSATSEVSSTFDNGATYSPGMLKAAMFLDEVKQKYSEQLVKPATPQKNIPVLTASSLQSINSEKVDSKKRQRDDDQSDNSSNTFSPIKYAASIMAAASNKPSTPSHTSQPANAAQITRAAVSPSILRRPGKSSAKKPKLTKTDMSTPEPNSGYSAMWSAGPRVGAVDNENFGSKKSYNGSFAHTMKYLPPNTAPHPSFQNHSPTNGGVKHEVK
jgi:hypothetical protein